MNVKPPDSTPAATTTAAQTPSRSRIAVENALAKIESYDAASLTASALQAQGAASQIPPSDIRRAVRYLAATS